MIMTQASDNKKRNSSFNMVRGLTLAAASLMCLASFGCRAGQGSENGESRVQTHSTDQFVVLPDFLLAVKVERYAFKIKTLMEGDDDLAGIIIEEGGAAEGTYRLVPKSRDLAKYPCLTGDAVSWPENSESDSIMEAASEPSASKDKVPDTLLTCEKELRFTQGGFVFDERQKKNKETLKALQEQFKKMRVGLDKPEEFVFVPAYTWIAAVNTNGDKIPLELVKQHIAAARNGKKSDQGVDTTQAKASPERLFCLREELKQCLLGGAGVSCTSEPKNICSAQEKVTQDKAEASGKTAIVCNKVYSDTFPEGLIARISYWGDDLKKNPGEVNVESVLASCQRLTTPLW